MSDIERIVAGLTEAQRRAVAAATWTEARGAWHPEGWYCAADKRVRYRLATERLIGDYIRPQNRLTPLGQQVRAHLERQAHD